MGQVQHVQPQGQPGLLLALAGTAYTRVTRVIALQRSSWGCTSECKWEHGCTSGNGWPVCALKSHSALHLPSGACSLGDTQHAYNHTGMRQGARACVQPPITPSKSSADDPAGAPSSVRWFSGVFDGHGQYGKEVSHFVKDRLPKKLNRVRSRSGPRLPRAVLSPFTHARTHTHTQTHTHTHNTLIAHARGTA